jgi:hypothetical protein
MKKTISDTQPYQQISTLTSQETSTIIEIENTPIEIPIQLPFINSDEVVNSTQSTKIVELIISEFSHTDNRSIKSQSDFNDNYPDVEDPIIVKLVQNLDEDIAIFGLYTQEYGGRGVAIKVGERIGYFDICWFGKYDIYELYVSDFDNDEAKEAAFIFMGLSGTGVYIERLTMFELFEENKQIEAITFKADDQYNELSKLIDITVKNDIIIITNKLNKKELKTLPLYEIAPNRTAWKPYFAEC